MSQEKEKLKEIQKKDAENIKVYLERVLLTLDLKSPKLYSSGKQTAGREFHNLEVRGKKLFSQKPFFVGGTTTAEPCILLE